MTTLFFIVVLFALGYIAGRFHQQSQAFNRWMLQPPPQPSEYEQLQALKARAELEKNYEYQIPNYGMIDGTKIPLGQITREMRADPNFIPPSELGKWVPRKGKNVRD